ncbi:2-phospho-L-lactate guanylyltransferase [Salinigranum halophilum]|jgi:2-phospho-L-lactate guanylyltransferase|uniref:2-phospho-L-lactate guanylyltransferase n=1 Tax=Salinigranum halophilum TaxID=2565931 RepID=UPI00115E622B|nr:2-phospho-L-lactate guanylyltransferase [Salinigranum halophilum]
MRVVVPFDATTPKTRLAPVLDADERDAFARCMLRDVLAAAAPLGSVEVVATSPVDVDASASVRVDDAPLSAVVDRAVAETVGAEGAERHPLVVVMADLALATPDALTRLVDTDGDVVLVPGRGVGTNALVVRTPDFRTDFHGTSYLDHREAAAAVGTVGTVDSFRLSTDVDEPADLVEAFVHGGASTREWLASRFELVVGDDEGRVRLSRR